VPQTGTAEGPWGLEEKQVVEVPVVGDPGVPQVVIIQSQHDNIMAEVLHRTISSVG
jgi:hypothetical protein